VIHSRNAAPICGKEKHLEKNFGNHLGLPDGNGAWRWPHPRAALGFAHMDGLV